MLAIILGDPEMFWRHVAKAGPDDCWPWTGCLHTGSGYGQIKRTVAGKRKALFAHRCAYALTHGEVPDDKDVCHSCDDRYSLGDKTYRLCCNPGHLWEGTHKDNMEDMERKGRAAKVLNPDMVRAIRAQYAAGALQRELAAQHGLAQMTISEIVTYKTWSFF